MNNAYVFILFLALIAVFAYFYNNRRHPSRYHRYASLLRDDLYFYPARFPVPRPQLRPHEVPHFGRRRR